MFLRDSLVLGVLLYNVELWGFRERGEVERLQLKYIKWTLGLDMRIWIRLYSTGENEEGKNKGESVEFCGRNKGRDRKGGIEKMFEGKRGGETRKREVWRKGKGIYEGMD